MIRRFPCILFVSDVAHFWYVAALKIGSLVAHSVAVSPTTLTLGLFLSLKGLVWFVIYLLFIFRCFVLQCSKPMEKGKCPECGKVIGGEQHKFLGEKKIADR